MVTFVLFLCGLMVLSNCLSLVDRLLLGTISNIEFRINIIVYILVFLLIIAALFQV